MHENKIPTHKDQYFNAKHLNSALMIIVMNDYQK